MKILLINVNPVVGKLVTLSAQKTGDELTTASSVEELEPQRYDLVMMDDNAYSQELFEELKSKVSFSQSCFIGSRTSEKPKEFTREFNKPFLPTDLVDIFMEISSAASTEPEAPKADAAQAEPEVMEKPDLAEDDFDFDELIDISEEADDEELSFGNALENLDDLEDIEEELEKSHDLQKSVLDEDDVNEVKGLLEEEDETEEEDLDELEDMTPSYSADEKILGEINEALDELDEESEADADDGQDEPIKTETELTEEDLEDLFDDLEDEESEESLDEKSDEPALSEELLEEIDEEFSEDAEGELADLDDEMDEEISEPSIAEETAEENLSDDELDRMIEEMKSDEDEDAQEDLFAAAETDADASDALNDIDLEDEELDEFNALDELLDETEQSDTLDETPTKESLAEDLPDTLEEAEEKGEEEIDLSALSEEIEAALGELDDDDLLDELDEEEMEGFENDFSSISANDLKIALGEEVLQEAEADEEELDIQEELDALEFMDEEEDEDEPELIVGQGEFASLHEEALNEAMGERNESDNEHPELDEIDAFVDQIPVEGVSAEERSIENSGDASVAALEKLIATLKQDNVKEALKGMDMNIKISFSEKGK